MSVFRAINSSDEHVSDQNPGFRKDNYRDSVLEKLNWQGDTARKMNAQVFTRGGDFFHVKAANKTTMRTLVEVSKIHAAYPCPVFSVAGNHDISNNDLESVGGQPLGVLFETGVFNVLSDKTFEVGSMKIRYVGVPYIHGMDSEALRKLLVKKDENYLIAVVHALASMAPSERIQSFFNEPILDYRDLVYPGGPDAFFFGHYHKDQGIVQHQGVHFVNLGSISRGSLTFENMDRKPKISSMTISASTGISIEEIIVPHKDSSEIFDLEKKKVLEKQAKSLDEFIMKLRSSSTNVDNLEDKKKELDSLPTNVRSRVLDILEAVENEFIES